MSKEEVRCRRYGAAIMAGLFFLGGCHGAPRSPPDREIVAHSASWHEPKLVFPERLNRGYTLVLPGISGVHPGEHGIVTGLRSASVPSAIEFHDWTTGAPRLFYHLCGLERNRAEARKIAAKIVAYHERYPGRPVHLIGFSGGGGVVVLVLEALPPDHSVTRAILLAPSLANDYDLRLAMSRTEQGIHNFYSPWDVPFLMVLSTAAGNTDGRHSLPAGAVGFHVPKTLDASQRQAYQERLPQQRYQLAMLRDGHTGGHVGWTVPAFVARQVAPLIGPSAEAQNHWHTTQPDLAPIHHKTASSASRTISGPGTKHPSTSSVR
jgi:pimeloyl-ACP methyl ester carboxylesterase